MVGARWF